MAAALPIIGQVLLGVGTVASAGVGVANYIKSREAEGEMRKKAEQQQAEQTKLLDDARKKEQADKDAAIFAAQQAGSLKRSGQKKLPAPTQSPGFASPLGQPQMQGYKTMLGT